MNPPIVRRALAGAVGVSLLLGVGLATSVSETDAAFTDHEIATTTVSAMTMPAPTITSCTVQGVPILGTFQSVTIKWNSPYDQPYVELSARKPSGQPGIVSAASISKTGPVDGPYSYSATIEKNILDALLNNLLGGTTILAVVDKYPGSTSWRSPESTKTLVIGALGGLLGNSCT